jgi:hypothetical protein
MYTAYIVRRTQIYLDEEQDRRLARRARAEGVTKSRLIRRAIDAYLEAGYNYIDTYVVKSGSTYHAFTKNETSKYIEHWTSTSLTSGWSNQSQLWSSGYEGPAVLRMSDGSWRIWIDKYTNGGIWTATSRCGWRSRGRGRAASARSPGCSGSWAWRWRRGSWSGSWPTRSISLSARRW